MRIPRRPPRVTSLASVVRRAANLAMVAALWGCNSIDAPSSRSPASHAIAFLEFPKNAPYGTLAVMRDDGSDLRTISGRFWSPAFSPDGATIAAAGDSGDSTIFTSLFVMNPDGSNRRALFSWNVVSSPAWSPDGREIAFLCSDTIPGYSTHLCVIGADGSGLRRVTGRDIGADHPSWSPDGRQIVFECRPGNFIVSIPGYSKPPEPYTPSSARGICLANADSSGWRQLTSGYDYSPTWSWATNRIAFAGGDTVLTIITPDGAVVRTLPTPGFSSVLSPAWSPDGQRLAFEAEKWKLESNGFDAVGVYLDFDSIYVIDVNGGGLTRLTNGFDAIGPAWSVH